MEISQYIKDLLVSNERVILKDFGAFNTKQVSAKYDEETQTMKPPFKIVTFDQNIKEDSGLLSEYIAKQESFTKNASEELINGFVKTIKDKLSSEKTVEFKDLGTFKQLPDGTLNFAFLSKDNLLLDAFGLPAVSVSEKKDKTLIPKKENTNVKVQRKEPIRKTLIKKDPLKKTPIKTDPLKKTPIKKQRNRVQKQRNPKKEIINKKRKKWPIFVILFSAIGLILTAIYFFKPNLWTKGYNFSTEKITSVKQIFNKDNGEYDIIDPDNENTDKNTELTENKTNNVVSQEEGTEEDDIVNDKDENNSEDISNEKVSTEGKSVNNDTAEKKSELTEVETNASISSANAGNFYLIIGSVKSETSAKKEKKRFAKKGITTSIIYVPNKDRYRISIGEFSSAKKAQDFYSNIQSKHGNIEAWVWEKK